MPCSRDRWTGVGEEVDRRAARVIADGGRGLDRDEVRSLFAMAPPEARARACRSPRRSQVIEVDPEAALDLLEARDFYENARPGRGAIFELVAQRTLDAVEGAPERFPIEEEKVRRGTDGRFPMEDGELVDPIDHSARFPNLTPLERLL